MHPFSPPTLPKDIRVYFSPALLVYSKKQAKEKIAYIKEYFPKAHLHVDVMDSAFVPAGCWCRPDSIGTLSIRQPFEAHLMTYHPEKRIAAWKRAGATRIVFHVEATEKPEQVIAAIHAAKLEACVAINPDTRVGKIKLLIPMVDAILVMGVHPGLAGQKFIPRTLKKVREISTLMSPKKLIIVDGGVTQENARALLGAGARQLVATSALYGKERRSVK